MMILHVYPKLKLIQAENAKSSNEVLNELKELNFDYTDWEIQLLVSSDWVQEHTHSFLQNIEYKS